MYLSEIGLRATTKRKFNLMSGFWEEEGVEFNGSTFYIPLKILEKFEFTNFVQLSKYILSRGYKRKGYPMDVFSTRLRNKNDYWEYLPLRDLEKRRNELITASGLELRVKKTGEDRGSIHMRFRKYEQKVVLSSVLIPLLHSDIFSIRVNKKIKDENDRKIEKIKVDKRSIIYVGIWAPPIYIATASPRGL